MARQSYTGDMNFFNPESRISAICYYDRGIQWYERQFKGRSSESAVGEKSAHYFADPDTPAKIHEHIPGAKLIAVLRNPIDRAYSHFWYTRGMLPPNATFIEACYSAEGRRIRLLESGFYYRNLLNYLHHFDRDRLHFILFEELCSDAAAVLSGLYRYLEVDPGFVPACINEPVNGAAGPGTGVGRLRAAGHFLKRKYPGLFRLMKLGLPVTWLENYAGRRMTHVSASFSYPPIDEADWRHLSEVYYESSRQMGEYLSIDLVELWHGRPSGAPTPHRSGIAAPAISFPARKAR